jgi:hypothetical protein
MPPKPAVRNSIGGAPARRPMIGAAAAKAKKEAEKRPASAAKARPGAAAAAPKKAGPTAKRELPSRGGSKAGPAKPSRDAPSGGEGGGGGGGVIPDEDDRGVRRSHDEYMSSANQRMANLQSSLLKKGGGKTGLEDYEGMDEDAAAEAADSAAMSMMDLLASLEGSGQTELGIFAGSVLQYSRVSPYITHVYMVPENGFLFFFLLFFDLYIPFEFICFVFVVLLF